MILSKIELSLTDPVVRATLRDAQNMHRLLTGLFQVPREEAKLLYRMRTQGTVLTLYCYADRPIVQERLLPGMLLTGERDLTDWLSSMQNGDMKGFDLLTMPFKKVSEEGGNSRRRVLRTQEERLAWLTRKSEQNGFAILEVQESADERISAMHPKEQGGRLYLDSYRYFGTLRITDAEAFQKAVREGIGPGKAYGLGMLLLR